jgi:hypothetical protein
MTFRMTKGTVIPDEKIVDQIPDWEAMAEKLRTDPNGRVKSLGNELFEDVKRMKSYAAERNLQPSGDTVHEIQGVKVTITVDEKAHLTALYGENFIANKDAQIGVLARELERKKDWWPIMKGKADA